MTRREKWLNFFERVLWTLLQVVTAEGILLFLNEVMNMGLGQIWVVIIATVLAAIKNAAAMSFGSPTGATLPVETQTISVGRHRPEVVNP